MVGLDFNNTLSYKLIFNLENCFIWLGFMSFLEFLPRVLNAEMTSARETRVVPNWHRVEWIISQPKMGFHFHDVSFQEWNGNAKREALVLYGASSLLSLLMREKKKKWNIVVALNAPQTS